DTQWLEHSGRFGKFAQMLQRQGVLAALLALFARYGTAARLRTEPGGERSLSNYLQLGEILQTAWQERADLDNLQVWLERHRESADSGGDAAQLRLETDERLVQIVTVHKSKGLEYPVVYLPYVWHGRKGNASDTVKFHDGARDCIDLGSERFDTHRDQMREESLAEELRLLYVALTRSSTQCTLYWGDISESSHTALAWLQGEYEATVAAGEFSQSMFEWIHEIPGAALLPEATKRTIDDSTTDTELRALNCAKPPRPSWQISSYSALVRSISHHVELPDYDSADATPVSSEIPETDLNSIMFFPRGAQAGTFLHYIFEHADFTQADQLDDLIRDSLASHGFAAHWQTAIKSMLLQVLAAPLYPLANFRLEQLADANRLNEMGFHFPVPQLHCQELLDVLREYGVLGPQEWLDFDTVKGYLTGFIDLIFRVDNRYYVLDYKSNHLGYSSDEYRHEALRVAMREHRYDLQYLIYTVALHRYLATRIPDYSYSKHMGGSFYLFLRGMRIDADDGPGIFYDKPPLALVEALDDLFAGQEVDA
ncbi:MAG: 3'-5' exonuclease, partial [Granulosicoccaceae bacterium]